MPDVTLPRLKEMRAAGEKIAMLTCYDASFAALMNHCGVEILLVGDSLGMVCQGHDNTLPVSMADLHYHTANVARGNSRAMLMADMPYGSYGTPQQAFDNAASLIKAGAHIVKLEGGLWLEETVRFLTARGIPVCVHLGLTPQFVHQLGGYKVQAKTAEAAARLEAEAIALADAGAAMLLLEVVPAAVGAQVAGAVGVPVIGIGAGPGCDGQVLVVYDMLGIYPGKPARFVRNFLSGQLSIEGAFNAYVHAVKTGAYPAAEHCF